MSPVPARIAIVDDDAAVRESLRFLLEVSGFAVDTFASAAEFQTGRAAVNPGGMILDHHMPIVSGLELVAQLRAAGDALPVLLITGSPSPAIAERAAALGVRVAEKPPSEHELLAFARGIAG
jgi:two-component system response regulator FixJ